MLKTDCLIAASKPPETISPATLVMWMQIVSSQLKLKLAVVVGGARGLLSVMREEEDELIFCQFNLKKHRSEVSVCNLLILFY